MALSLKLAPKVCTAEEAVSLIRDGDCVTVSGTSRFAPGLRTSDGAVAASRSSGSGGAIVSR